MKYAFFLGEYNGYVNTNKQIAFKLINELSKTNQCFIYSFSYRIDKEYRANIDGYDVMVYPANIKRSSVYNKYIEERKNNGRLINLIKHLGTTIKFHLTKSSMHKDLLSSLENSLIRNEIDYLFCFYFPFLPSYDILLDERIRCKKIIYQLDSWGFSTNSADRINEELKVYNKADYIFPLYSIYDRCKKSSEYQGLLNKMYPVSIPYIEKTEKEKANDMFDNNYYNIVYLGSLDDENRNPIVLLNYFKKIIDTYNEKIMVYFIGRNSSKVCEEFSKNNDFVKVLSPIGQDEVNDLLRSKGIFLLNIGNSDRFKHQIPSKVYSYISTGKPIINVVKSNEDLSVEILKKYNNKVNINETQSFDINELVKFLRDSKHAVLDYENILSNYNDSTAEYISQFIETTIIIAK